jgi:hypothetical protein
MPSILDAGNEAARKAALDAVAKNKLQAEVGTDGTVSASLNAVRKGFTFTAYVKALVVGQQKSVSAGARVERDF